MRGDGETRLAPAPRAGAASMVLGNDDLLSEILLRVGLPTILVRATAVCTRWYLHVSDRGFLRCFRNLHPPRLLGFYTFDDDCWVRRMRFVPILPQPLELATVVRRVSSSLDTYKSMSAVSTYFVGCRNGSILVSHQGRPGTSTTLGMHCLLFPERGLAMLPLCPFSQPREGTFITWHGILSKEEGDGVTYWHLLLYSTPPKKHSRERKHTAYVYMLRDGAWCMQSLAMDEIRPSPMQPTPVLVDNKIYMATAQSDIVVWDLMASSSSRIPLPEGVEHGERNTILSRADDASSVYLIHIEEVQLRIWLHKGGNWLLMDTICLREMCANLGMVDCDALPMINNVGDNAEFVFLRMGQCIFHLDIKCRTLCKLYEITNEDLCSAYIHPVVMIWPPTFRALKNDHSRETQREGRSDELWCIKDELSSTDGAALAGQH